MNIYNDSCFNVFPKIERESVDLVLVDLPYGQTACKWDIPIDLKEMWNQLKQIGKEKTAFVFFTTTKFGIKLIESNEKWFRYDLVWQKSHSMGFLQANKMPLRSHEMVYVFYKKLPTYNPQKTQGKPYHQTGRVGQPHVYNQSRNPETHNIDGLRYPLSIQKFNRETKTSHPTQKPTALCEWLIKTYSNEGDLVLDFTMGSGSTGVACKNTNRRFIGIEMDVDIYKVAEKRLSDEIISV